MGKSFDQFRHLDEEEYAREIAPLSPEELTALQGRITRKLIAASMGTAQGTLCAPLTAGMSLVPAAVGGRRVNVNVRRLRIIEARIAELHAERYHKRKRDFAIPAAVMGLSLGLAHGAEGFFIEHLVSDHAVHAATVATEMGQDHLYTAIHGQEAASGFILAAATAPQLAAPIGGKMPAVPSPRPAATAPHPAPVPVEATGPRSLDGSLEPEVSCPMPTPISFAPPPSSVETASALPPPPPSAMAGGSPAVPSPVIHIQPPPEPPHNTLSLAAHTSLPIPPPRPVSAIGFAPPPPPPPRLPATAPSGEPPLALSTSSVPLLPERPASALGHERVSAIIPSPTVLPTFPPPPLAPLPMRSLAPAPIPPAGLTRDGLLNKSEAISGQCKGDRSIVVSITAIEKMAEAYGTADEADPGSEQTPTTSMSYFPPPPSYQAAMGASSQAFHGVDQKYSRANNTPATYVIPSYNPSTYAR